MGFDQHLINLLIVLLPLAIFIGRAITNARNRHERSEANQENSPRERAFREEDDYESSSPTLSRGVDEYFRGLQVTEQPRAKPARRKESAKPRKAQSGSALDKTILTHTEEPVPAARTKAMATGTSNQSCFTSNLNHLSPLKQAIVMAEILGSPKGMRDN